MISITFPTRGFRMIFVASQLFCWLTFLPMLPVSLFYDFMPVCVYLWIAHFWPSFGLNPTTSDYTECSIFVLILLPCNY